MYTQILHEIQQSMSPFANDGAVSNSIPELALIDPSKFGIHLVTTQGIDYGIGDSNERFSIQSISKVLALSHAFTFVGENIWNRVGVEPSGNPFNSLVQLEYEKGRCPCSCRYFAQPFKQSKKRFFGFCAHISPLQHH